MAVVHGRAHHRVSEGPACALGLARRRGIRYEATEPDGGALRQGLHKSAAERRRLGYRRLRYVLPLKDITPHHKRLLSSYRQEGLRVRGRCSRRRVLGTRRPIAQPNGPNQLRSLAFVSDSLI